MKVRFRALALADLENIFQFLNERSPAGARNVLRAIHDAIGEITAHPFAAPRTSDPTLRVKILGRYRYKIFYEIDGETIDIIHIRHAARRPWIAP
jgi:toxin ParE1/3/4